MSNDNIKIKFHGILSVWKDDGVQRTLISSKQNQIVNVGLGVFSRLIAQLPADDPVEEGIHSLWIEASATALPAADKADTGAQGTVVKRYTFDKAVDVTPNSGGTLGLTVFSATLAKAEAVGQTLRAAGLYTRSDNDDPTLATNPLLVARQVFGAIDKTADFALDFEWQIQFTIVESP